MMKRYGVGRILLFFVLALLVGNFSLGITAAPATRSSDKGALKLLHGVGLSASKFNPRLGERAAITFSLVAAARVTLKIFDPDFELVRVLLDGAVKKAGDHTVAWDGKDLAGSLVPDEAYFFTIEAKDSQGNLDVYDPTTFSGGEVYSGPRADIDKEKNEVRYALEQAGRVSIRIGVQRGPLLKTLADWQPRPAGLNAEPWDGTDESGVLRVVDDPFFILAMTYFSLPENSMITWGNEGFRYHAYKAGLPATRPKKEDRERKLVSSQPISPHFAQVREAYRNPKIQVSFPEIKNVTADRPPLIEGTTVIGVDMDEKEKLTTQGQKTELYLFLDNQFLIEDGQAQMPYQFHWNFSNVREGEHLLTVNLLTDNDQMATASKKIVVKRSQAPKELSRRFEK